MLELTNISTKNLADVAEKICTYSPSHNLICFVGEMGAGKTTLIKEVFRGERKCVKSNLFYCE